MNPSSVAAPTTSAPHGGRPANRLAQATSPYLLQHAHNPVDWYEWGPEALDRARREDKPIFLSIGYSACHWCHVMERESFENDDIAAVLNARFVCIKVDREERPDLDDIYMAATMALTGSGGWPMSVWLTPDLRPFFAGTYFPPDDRYGRPGFRRVLLMLDDAWRNKRDICLEQSDALADAVRRFSARPPGDRAVPHDVVVHTARRMAAAFDPVKGGISGGGTNKFPPSMAMDLMLRAHHHLSGAAGAEAARAAELLDRIEVTLERMAHGGIYDHLGGGIARYSTDVDWLVPHFEKMLYDQALVSSIYLDAYRLTRKPLYARVARDIFDYVLSDLRDPGGAFYSSRDADSEGVEGKYYVWSRVEVVDALGEADAELFCGYYDVSDAGNWEGHNILNVPRPAEAVARLHGISVEALHARLADARLRLLAVRARRVPPHRDDKILASWNGLMIASLARGASILGDARYAEAAGAAADFILGRMIVDGRLHRVHRQGRTRIPAYLDDHAFLIEGLLNLYETTFDSRRLDEAERLNDAVLAHFRDEAGGFFFTAADAEPLLVRAKDASDSAIPSGNSVQLMNLLRLAVLRDRRDLREEADRLIRAFSDQLIEGGFRSERMLAALDFHLRGPRELALVAPRRDDPGLRALLEAAWGCYVPNLVVAARFMDTAEASAVDGRIPLLEGKALLNGRAAAFVCRDYACRAPTNDPSALAEQLRAR